MHKTFWVAGCVALGACAGQLQSPEKAGAWGFCAPPEAPPRAMPEDPVPRQASRGERIAALLGISDEIREARAAREGQALAARMVVLEQVELTRTVLEATVAELDCESERSSQLASYLQSRKDRWTTRFTIASVVVGAATTIASGVLVGTNSGVISQEVVAVSGGALAAGLALVPLFDHPRLEIKHPRNPLADVWLGPRVSSTFPEVVWAYLTRPEFSNSQAQSIRANVVARWKEYQRHGTDVDVGLQFGAGGRYDATNLTLRTAMLEQIKAEVRLMNQDLATLVAAPGAGR
jgi:hypothetical protein